MATDDGYHAQLFARMIGDVDHWLALVYRIDEQGRFEFAGLTPLRSSTAAKALTLAGVIATRHRDRYGKPWGDIHGQPVALDLRPPPS